MSTFAELNLPLPLLESLGEMGFLAPTPIQAQAIPAALQGKDILAIAPTGTGKTGAFGIPSLSYLHGELGKQVLILAPTRELAAQIHKFLRKLGEPFFMKGTLIVGGESYYRQRCEVKEGVDYIVATPGRLMDHIEQGMPLENIRVLVLDEVDRMLDMGFAPQIKQIVERLPQERQTYLFSATLPAEISKLAEKLLKQPVKINIVGKPEHKPKIEEEKIETHDVEKPRHLIDQVEQREGKILVFANTQGRVEQVTRKLEHAGQPAASIHGGRSHGERKYALEAFRSGRVRILVATDIVARGIDVADVEHVINYDYPETEEDYLHRIGRTGRFGKAGKAVTFVDAERQRRSLRRQKFSRRAVSPRPTRPERRMDSRPERRMDSRPERRMDSRPERRMDRPRPVISEARRPRFPKVKQHQAVPARSRDFAAVGKPRTESERRQKAMSRVDRILKPVASFTPRQARPQPSWVRGNGPSVRRRSQAIEI